MNTGSCSDSLGSFDRERGIAELKTRDGYCDHRVRKSKVDPAWWCRDPDSTAGRGSSPCSLEASRQHIAAECINQTRECPHEPLVDMTCPAIYVPAETSENGSDGRVRSYEEVPVKRRAEGEDPA